MASFAQQLKIVAPTILKKTLLHFILQSSGFILIRILYLKMNGSRVSILDRPHSLPWLIKRFIEADADIIYVPADQVIAKAAELNAVPFDLPGVEYTHYLMINVRSIFY